MTKSTFATKQTRKSDENLRIMGEQIRLARLRRNLTLEQVAERATCSRGTIMRVEKGCPTVAIGIYARVLVVLRLVDDLLLIAQNDPLGRTLQDLGLKQRQRAPKRSKLDNV